MRPAFSRTRRCLEMAGSEMENGLARSVTQHSVRARRSRIRRRVGSDKAPKTASRDGPSECLTIWLNILRLFIPVQPESDGRDAILRDSALNVSTPFSFLLCESAHGPGEVRPFLSSLNVRRRIARERVPTTHNCGSHPFRVRARIARERVPTTHNCGSHPFRVRRPDRAGARPYHAQLRITSLSRATPDRAVGTRSRAIRRCTSSG